MQTENQSNSQPQEDQTGATASSPSKPMTTAEGDLAGSLASQGQTQGDAASSTLATSQTSDQPPLAKSEADLAAEREMDARLKADRATDYCKRRSDFRADLKAEALKEFSPGELVEMFMDKFQPLPMRSRNSDLNFLAQHLEDHSQAIRTWEQKTGARWDGKTAPDYI